MSEASAAPRWAGLRRAGRPGLVVFLTAGYPTPAATRDALRMLADEGADVLELGIPFSDPLADGPVIQRASDAALRGGMTVRGVLELVSEAARIGLSTVVFTYLNPVLQYGPDRFLQDAAAAGAQGLLLTDVPAGADPALEREVRASPLDLIRLIAPTTTPARLDAALADAEGFVYVVARLGVTGQRTEISRAIATQVDAVRRRTDLPVVVGFGIADGAQARAVARFADGVVVGSALVERLGEGLEAARTLVTELRQSLDAVPVG